MERPEQHPTVVEKNKVKEATNPDINDQMSPPVPGDEFSQTQEPILAEDIALSDDKVKQDPPAHSLNDDRTKTEMRKAANYETYLPEQYLNRPDHDIKNVVSRALNANEIKFVEKLIKELQAHARRKTLITQLWGMLEEHNNAASEPVKKPAGQAQFSGPRTNDNKEYLCTLSREQLVRIGQQLGLTIDPGKEIPAMASSIAEYYKISKLSKKF